MAGFKDQLRKLREKLGLSQAEVASLLGVSPPRISEWERAVRTPKPLTQEAIVLKMKKARPARPAKSAKPKKKKR